MCKLSSKQHTFPLTGLAARGVFIGVSPDDFSAGFAGGVWGRVSLTTTCTGVLGKVSAAMVGPCAGVAMCLGAERSARAGVCGASSACLLANSALTGAGVEGWTGDDDRVVRWHSLDLGS